MFICTFLLLPAIVVCSVVVIQELKEEIRAMQGYLDTANDQIQVQAKPIKANLNKSKQLFESFSMKVMLTLLCFLDLKENAAILYKTFCLHQGCFYFIFLKTFFTKGTQ